MLSYIYHQINNFQNSHGVLPNVLYLNNEHYQRLLGAYDASMSVMGITQHLQLELVIDATAIHPHVAWVYSAQYRRVS